MSTSNIVVCWYNLAYISSPVYCEVQPWSHPIYSDTLPMYCIFKNDNLTNTSTALLPSSQRGFHTTIMHPATVSPLSRGHQT